MPERPKREMKPTQAESPTVHPAKSLVPLESVLCTEELNRRPARPPDYETENRALVALAQALADSPRTILQTLVETILKVIEAGSAGLSLLTKDETRFYWPAIAGVWKSHVGGGTPRDFGPCGDVLDRNTPLLFKHLERRYPYFLPVTPAVEEALLVPFYVGGKAIGTIWALTHDDHRKFDAEDLRKIVSLSGFASLAYRQSEASVSSLDSRRAALNLMEDAVRSRRTTETLNAELRESEERYRNLFNSMDEGYCVMEVIFDEHEKPVDYRFLEVNLAFEEQSGMHEATGKRIRELVPDIEEYWMETYGKVALTGEAIRFVNEAKTMDASWFDVNAFRLGGPESRKVAVLFRNIKERKDAENALRESEERYRNLFNSMDEGFCIIEMIFDEHNKPVDYRFLEVNPSFEKQIGLHNVTGKRVREIVPDLEAFWFEIYGKVALTGEPIRFTNEVKALNTWLDIYAARLGGSENRKVAVIFSNITERIEIESSLNNAIAVAERANLAKTDFLSSMSHELRTPLSAILGFAQLMESASPPPTPSQKRSIDQILQAGWYLLEMINEILDLALIESGKLSLSLEPVSLTEVMHECQTMIETQAQKRGISVAFPSFESSYFVQADRTRLKQVLINLLSNAIKYNRVGGTIVVDCIASTAERIRIRVKDTGKGLALDKLTQLFQPFNRIGQEAGIEEGTGIGLVMCKRLVELMGGEIGVESTVGTGSVFWIELNLMAEPQPAAAVSTVVTQAQVHGEALLRTVLYVEDNPANLMLIEDLVARWPDIRLLSAADGKRGVEIALASRPDVILMDINLPGISGIQALEILRDIPATAHIPVIALTANAMPRDIAKGLAAGFFRYLTKPIKVNEFLDTLDVALKLAKTESARVNKEGKA